MNGNPDATAVAGADDSLWPMFQMYFAESISSEVGFESWTCESWEAFEKDSTCLQNPQNLMGYPANASAPGIFYLRTNSAPPFAIPTHVDIRLLDRESHLPDLQKLSYSPL